MEGESTWLRAHCVARDCLRRFHDPWTRQNRDDLAQDVAIAVWRWANRLRHRERFWSAVHTITWRLRAKALRAQRPELGEPEVVAAAIGDAGAPDRVFVVAGRRVATSRLRPWVHEALRQLKPLDRELLLGFYQGRGCSELAERFRRSRACVKTRIHRARVRVQKDVEALVRTAARVDE